MVWVWADPAPNTGDTVSAPWLHTVAPNAITSWLESFGGVASSREELGQVLSEPVGTSEYPTLKYAVAPGTKVTLAGGRSVNAKPSPRMVAWVPSGAPDASSIRAPGKPNRTHELVDVLRKSNVHSTVPAAPFRPSRPSVSELTWHVEVPGGTDVVGLVVVVVLWDELVVEARVVRDAEALG